MTAWGTRWASAGALPAAPIHNLWMRQTVN